MLWQILDKIIYGLRVIFDLTKWFIVSIVFLTIISNFFFSIFTVDGASMEPNLHDRESILWSKNSYSKVNPERLDVVVVRYPGDPMKKKYVKRIIGMPNEKVTISDGAVYIDDELLTEEYLPIDLTTPTNGEWQLKSNQYFVMGDNRPSSSDSRNFGPVEKRFVLGKSIAIIFPRLQLVRDI
jgi:signal peptidase I